MVEYIRSMLGDQFLLETSGTALVGYCAITSVLGGAAAAAALPSGAPAGVSAFDVAMAGTAEYWLLMSATNLINPSANDPSVTQAASVFAFGYGGTYAAAGVGHFGGNLINAVWGKLHRPVAASAPSSAIAPLMAGVEFEAQQLAQLGLLKNTRVWRPTIEQTQSAAFKVIVGEAKYTNDDLLKESILDATKPGLLEIKDGHSVLISSYQLRLHTYRSLIESQTYTIRTSRPINSTFRDWLERWGVAVEGAR